MYSSAVVFIIRRGEERRGEERRGEERSFPETKRPLTLDEVLVSTNMSKDERMWRVVHACVWVWIVCRLPGCLACLPS